MRTWCRRPDGRPTAELASDDLIVLDTDENEVLMRDSLNDRRRNPIGDVEAIVRRANPSLTSRGLLVTQTRTILDEHTTPEARNLHVKANV